MPEFTIGKVKVRTFEAPPKGFDPIAASAATLAHHGFPERPDPQKQPQTFALWHREMTKFRNLGFQVVAPDFKQLNISHGPSRRRKPGDRGLVNATSDNWSGSVLFTDAATDPFTWISGEWTVPNVYSPTATNASAYYSSAWLGIDGDGSPDVLQAGTASEVSGTSVNCYAWWEWYPETSIAINGLAFKPGDSGSLTICSTGPNTAFMSYRNLTSLQATSFSITAPAGTNLVGNCAEAICERPGVNGELAQLPRYGECFFNNVTAHTKSGASFGIGTGTPVSMVADDGSTVISTPNVLDGDSIRCAYTGS